MLKTIVEQDDTQFEITPIGPKRLRNPSIDTKLFLKAWGRHDPRVAMYVDEKVKRELKITLPPNEHQRYVRVFKFRNLNAVNGFFQVPFEQLAKGQRVTFQTSTITTWTKDAKEAIKYGDVTYDNFNKRHYSLRDYQKMGINDQQPVGYSVTVMCMVPYDKVLVDLANVPVSLVTRSTNKDILVMPGEYAGVVLETNTANADITSMINKQQSFRSELESRDQIIRTEMEQLEKAKAVVPQLLKKAGYKEKDLTDNDLIDFVYKHNDVAIAAGIILAYGDRFPSVVEWIKNSKTHFIRSPWKFITLDDLIASRQ